jgi:hypothetical protein
MKQKFKITKKYDPLYDHDWYRGYKYVFFNLIPFYVVGTLAHSYKECEDSLMANFQSNKKEITIRKWTI